MNIIIVGAGTVGYSLAQVLSYKHNVIILDKDIRKLQQIEENLDILTFSGNSEDPRIYERLPMKAFDLFIAVTDSDEANILSSLIVEDKLTIHKKIIRLKNEYFAHTDIFTRLNIDEHIFPDLLTAQKVQALFSFPKANNIKTFQQCDQKLISVKVHYADERQYRVLDLEDEQVVVVGIERKKSFLVPDETTVLKERDLVYFFGDAKRIRELARKLETKMPETIKNVVIFGANPSARKIAAKLTEDKSLSIKMIEKDVEDCKAAAALLQDKVTIINAPFEEHNLFESEGLAQADIFIAAKENDEKNIVKCIEAREYGIEKVVAINNDKAYYALMHQLGIVVVRGARISAHYAILEKISSSAIVNVSHFCGGNAVMFIRKIYPNSPLIGKVIKPLKLPSIRLYQLRNGAILKPDAFTEIEVDDTIVIFGETEYEEEIRRWIYAL